MTQTKPAAETKKERRLEKEITLAASVEEVWKALTDPKELAKWFSLEARVTPGPGGKMFLSWGKDCEGGGEIVAWEPGKKLAWKGPFALVEWMERLKLYLGEWDYTETYPKSAFYPNGGNNTGVYTSKLGPGGNSLINTFHSQGPVGDFEGLLVMTWDAREKAYKAYAFGNGFPGALVETGQFEGDALVYRSEFPVEGATLKLRNTTRLVAPGKIASDEYSAMPGAPETLLVHVEARKR